MSERTFEGMMDRAEDPTVEFSALRRVLWTALGTIALAVGIVGIVLPLVPTTPLVLAAAACYLRGSPRMHRFLVTNRMFGKIISDYVNGNGISWRVRITALTFLWTSLGASYLIFDLPILVLPVLITVGYAVSVHIVRLPFKRD